MDLKPGPEAGFWDRAYDGAEYRYGKQPNAFLRECAGAIAPGGRVLSLGDGEGRNGVWLAAQGFRVTCLDQSRSGLEKARALAAERGVEIRTIHAALPDHPLGEAAFDAVVLIFLHLAPEVRRAVHAAAARALVPGGVVVLEAFTPAQLGRPSGGPPTRERLQTAADLRADFAGLAIERLEELETSLDEGPGHSGPASVVRLLARRVLR
jgi:SAM-dependent methyltransferase